MKMFNKIKGFTVIELVIIVVIISILATIAIPAYQNYVIRGRVAEALSYGSHAKVAVTEYYQTQGTFPTNNTQAGLSSGTLTASNVSAVLISQGGIITITTSIRNATGTLTLTPTATSSGINWSCEALSLDSKYLPSSCRTSPQVVASSPQYNTSDGNNLFTDASAVSAFFGGQPKIDGVSTPIQWFIYSNVAKITEADLASRVASGSFHISTTLTKQDGTAVTNLNQFCGAGYRGVVLYNGYPANAGLACVSA